ncbi:hypothetical protein HMPREF0379_0382 [[Eubacterium] yurii subsp. margaretiae ATCC 43715]|nr:hypothetical protein HMPREF0379_0382 [[Eubacterium] yurii subsp. margaretiae ATCC 43715]
MKKVLFILVLFLTLSISPSFADSAQIFSNVNSYNNKLVKIGNYTFNYKADLFRVFDKTGKKLLITVDNNDFDRPSNYPTDFFASDKYVYYVKFKSGKGSSVMQIDLKSKKTKEIRKFPIFINIQAVKGNDIYYNIDEGNVENDYIPSLKVFNINTKKDTHIAKNATDAKLGKTRLFYMGSAYDVNAIPFYSITYDYKNPKLISSTVFSYEIIGSKVYYAQAKQVKLPDGRIVGDTEKQTLYVCNEDGSDKKALTGVITGYITKIKPEEIEYRAIDSPKGYKMNLKTKKVVAIP